MNSPFLLLVGFLACFVRFYISDITEDRLIMIMSLINIIALDYVILILFQSAKNSVKRRMLKSHYTEKMLKVSTNKINVCYTILYFIIFAIFNFIYLRYLHSAAWNDCISIMALVISISSDRLSVHIANALYKIL